jgi:hypothetical protein
MWKKEILIFISKNLQHIEIDEKTTLFGFVWREETREAYIPRMDGTEKDKLRVIAESYEIYNLLIESVSYIESVEDIQRGFGSAYDEWINRMIR